LPPPSPLLQLCLSHNHIVTTSALPYRFHCYRQFISPPGWPRSWPFCQKQRFACCQLAPWRNGTDPL